MNERSDITFSAEQIHSMSPSQVLELVLNIHLHEWQRQFIDTIDFDRPHSITLRYNRKTGNSRIYFDKNSMLKKQGRPQSTK